MAITQIEFRPDVPDNLKYKTQPYSQLSLFPIISKIILVY